MYGCPFLQSIHSTPSKKSKSSDPSDKYGRTSFVQVVEENGVYYEVHTFTTVGESVLTFTKRRVTPRAGDGICPERHTGRGMSVRCRGRRGRERGDS
jgi:hypothetical protein